MSKRPLPNVVEEKLKLVPTQPGCYIYKDEAGAVLYVGKALVLRNRVRSYFQASAKHGPRIERLVKKVRDIEWMVVDSEIEALVLECNLIKKHRPPFNVRMRDDKSYPYITITEEDFPRVMFTRKPRKDKSKYFGPYPSAFAVRDTLQLLHKTFPLIPCGKSWTGAPVQRPCLYYHLGRCLGPCAGLSDRKEYQKTLDRVERFLSGKEELIVEDLKKEMGAAAEALDFEKAAKIRDQIAALQTVLSRQRVLSSELVDQDVIAVVKDDRGSAIQMLYIRGGKLIGQRQYILDGSAEAGPSEAVGEFVKQYYADSPDVPREILLPVEIEERGIVQTWLRQRKGSAVNVEVPQTGEKAKLVDMAAANAEQALAQFAQELQQKEMWAEEAMGQLQDALGLDMPPVRVEGYDISNIQGTAPVGSMVVTENGEAAKEEYRRFKIRYHPESPNDFAMMHEVLTRRLKAYVDGDEKFQKLPDLIVVDGGKGQLSAALKARDELGLTVPMVGLAKRHELIYAPYEPKGELFDAAPVVGLDLLSVSGGTPEAPTGKMPVPLGGVGNMGETPVALGGEGNMGETPMPRGGKGNMGGPPVPHGGEGNMGGPPMPREYSYERPALKTYLYREIEMPLNSPGLLLLRRLRDESHRFALSYHRKLRDKKVGGSSLDEIPGVGPRRKRLLLRTFGSLEGIRRATADEIAAVPTLTKAVALKIKDYLAEA